MFKTKPELVAFLDEHSRTRQQTLSPKYKATSKLTPHLPNKSLIIFALGFPYGVDQNLADWLPEPIQERRRPFLIQFLCIFFFSCFFALCFTLFQFLCL